MSEASDEPTHEPATPLVLSRSLGRLVGLGQLWLKLEGQRRSGSWLDRGAARVVARARAAGAAGLVSLASDALGPALALRALPTGLPVVLVTVKEAAIPAGELAWAAALGARVVRVAGDRAALGTLLAREAAASGLEYVSRADDALRAGVLEAGLEIAVQLGAEHADRLPVDVVALASLLGGEGAWLADLLPAPDPEPPSRRGKARPRSGIVVEGRYGVSGPNVVTPREADAARRLLAREEGILASRRGVAGLVALFRAAREKALPPAASAVALLANEVGSEAGPPLAVEETPLAEPVPFDLLGDRLRQAILVPPR